MRFPPSGRSSWKRVVRSTAAPTPHIKGQPTVSSSIHSGPLEHSDAHPSCEGGPKIFAALQILWADDLKGQDRFRRLGAGADDQRISDRFEPPSCRNGLHL